MISLNNKNIAIISGILVVGVLLTISYRIITSTHVPPQHIGWSTTPSAGGAYGVGIPSPPTYSSIGDSTADGTPVDGTEQIPADIIPAVVESPVADISGVPPPVASSPIQLPAADISVVPPVVSPDISLPVAMTPATPADQPQSTIIQPPVVQPPVVEPPVVIDCKTMRNAMIAYYNINVSPKLTPQLILVNNVDNNTCDAGFQLVDPGTTVVRAADSRRFTFDKNGIVSMGGTMSGSTVIPPTIVPPITDVIDAPPTSLISDYGKYFKKFAGNIWSTVGTTSNMPLSECQQTCYNNANCTGINFQPSAGQCSMLANTGPAVLTADAGNDFYQRIPTKTVIPVYPSQITAGDTTNYMSNFTEAVGKYFGTTNQTVINVNKPIDCAAACQKDTNCTSFNHWPSLYKCDLIRGYNGQSLIPNPGATFYNKVPMTPTPVVAPSPPPVIIDCLTQKSAMDSYYALKSGTTLKPMPREYKQVSDNTCDAGFDLVIPGTTTVAAVDSRRFTFNSSGIATMGGAMSGTSITLPTVVPPITTVMDAPPIDLITDFTKYFKKFANQIWQTTTGSSTIVPSVDTCQRSCYASSTCTGFNYQPDTNRCSLIANTGSPVLSPATDPLNDFYQRIPTKTVVPVYPQQIAAGDTTNYMSNFTPTAAKYFSTGDITTLNVNTLQDCAAACQKDYTCSAFNHWPSTYKCDLLRGYTNQTLSSHSAANFYKRITPSIPPAPATVPTTRPPAYDDELARFSYSPSSRIVSAFYTYPNARNGLSNGVQVYAGGTPAGCAKACYNDITCRGFNINKNDMSCNLITTDVYPYPTTTGSSGWDSYMIYDLYGYAPQIEPTPVAAAPAPAPVSTVGGASTNERCGPNWGGTKCPTGLCCSSSDWCGPAVGTTTAWCTNGGRGRDDGIYDGV